MVSVTTTELHHQSVAELGIYTNLIWPWISSDTQQNSTTDERSTNSSMWVQLCRVLLTICWVRLGQGENGQHIHGLVKLCQIWLSICGVRLGRDNSQLIHGLVELYREWLTLWGLGLVRANGPLPHDCWRTVGYDGRYVGLCQVGIRLGPTDTNPWVRGDLQVQTSQMPNSWTCIFVFKVFLYCVCSCSLPLRSVHEIKRM